LWGKLGRGGLQSSRATQARRTGAERHDTTTIVGNLGGT
jgi:hypothetical protein